MHAEARVDSYSVPLDAELAKAYLESYKIPVRLEGEALVGSAFALGPMLGGIRLLVGEEDEARARVLLDSYHQALHRRSSVPVDDDLSRDAPDECAESSDESPDSMVARAWSSTLLAFVLLPVVMHLYAVALLLRVPFRELSERGKRRYAISWGLNLVVLLAAGWLAASTVG